MKPSSFCLPSNQNWNKVKIINLKCNVAFCANLTIYFILFTFVAQTDSEFTERQLFISHLAVAKVKETVSRLASEHRDLHSSVSKVGKTIDRV